MKKTILFLACTVTFIFVLMLAVSAAPTFADWGAPIYGVGQMHIFGNEGAYAQGHDDGWYVPAANEPKENEGYGNYLDYINKNVARVELTYVKNGTTHTVTYPTYYILKNDSTLTWDFERVSTALGVTIGVDNITKIEIPYGITVIPERAFVDSDRWKGETSDANPKGYVATPHPNLTYVHLSNTVLRIEDFAFAHCENLTEVGSETLGDHEDVEGPAMGNHNHQMLQHIGYRAFHYCSLTSFNFNKHLVYLGEGAFRGNNFTSINLSKCVELKVIPKHCFHETDGSLTSIILPIFVERLEDYAFTGSSADTVFLGLTLKYVGHKAFSSSKKVSVFIMPTTIETIYPDSFVFSDKSYVPVVVPLKTKDKIDDVFAVFDEKGFEQIKFSNNTQQVYDRSEAYWKDNLSFCTTYLGGHIADPYSGVERIEYPYGIQHEGVAYGGACAVCGNPSPESKFVVRPILISKGYSICTYNGLYAFSNGFEIYHNALHLYEQVYGEVELGILFLRSAAYQAGSDLRNNISSMGVCLDRATLLQGADPELFSSMDFIFTYSKGLGSVNGSETSRGDEEVVIAAYLLHKNEDAKHPIYDANDNKTGEVEMLYNTSHYVQDTDDLCVKGATSDGKYVTVSYYSIYGEIQRQGGI